MKKFPHKKRSGKYSIFSPHLNKNWSNESEKFLIKHIKDDIYCHKLHFLIYPFTYFFIPSGF